MNKRQTKKHTTRSTAAKPTRPRVASVYYQTSKQVAPYCHRHFGVEVAVEGFTVRQALERAVELVHSQLGIPNEAIRPRTVLGIEAGSGRSAVLDEDLELYDIDD